MALQLPLDVVSTSTCNGAYAAYRVSSSYIGPTMTVRRSVDNVTLDFYANAYGQLGTALNGTGTTLESWLNTSSGYVTKWYDQSGKGNHATQTSTSNQPIIDCVNNRLDFTAGSGTAYLSLPTGTVPTCKTYSVTGYISTNSASRTTLIGDNNNLQNIYDNALTATVVMNGIYINAISTAYYIPSSRTDISLTNEFSAVYGFFDGTYTKAAQITYRMNGNTIDVYQSNAMYWSGNVTSQYYSTSGMTASTIGSGGYGAYSLSIVYKTSYTVTVKHNTIGNTSGTWLGAAPSTGVNLGNGFRRSSASYVNYWYGNDFTGNANTYAAGNIVTYAYDGNYSYLYINGTSQGVSSIRSGWNGQSGNECIGRNAYAYDYFNGEMYSLFLFKSFLSINDRTHIEKHTMAPNAIVPIKFSQLKNACGITSGTSFSLSQVAKYAGIPSSSAVAVSKYDGYTLRNGLFMRFYSNVYFNNVISYFNNNTPTMTGVVTNFRNTYCATGGLSNPNSTEYKIGTIAVIFNYSVEWFGLFFAPISGTYTFYITSDDTSFIWIGTNALSGYTESNTLLNTKLIYTEISATISLTSGTYYPFRFQYGAGGSDNLLFSFAPPGGSRTYDGTGYFFSQAINNPNNAFLSVYFPFEQVDVSGTTLTNKANSSYNATLYNGATISTTSFKLGSSSLSLTASLSQYAQLSNFTPTANGLTFSFWYKSNGNATWARIFDFGNGTPSDNIIISPTGDGANGLTFVTFNGTTSYSYSLTDINYNNNTWIHIVWTLSYATPGNNTSTWNIYVNGVNKYSSSVYAYPLLVTRTNNYIGKSAWTADAYYNGNIDEFRIHDTVLSATDATALYNNTAPNYKYTLLNPTGYFSFLSVYFPFEQADVSGTTLTNKANSSYNATLYNGATVSTTSFKLGSSSLSLTASSSQYAQLSNFTPTTNGLTFSFWYKSNTINFWGRIFDFGNGSANDNIFVSPSADAGGSINPTYLAVSCFYGSNENKVLLGGINYNDNTWRHIVWTLSYAPPGSYTSTWNVYVNGVNKFSSSSQLYPSPFITRRNLYIGRSNWSSDSYYNGNIDEFIIYNTVISATDVTTLYNNTSSTYAYNMLNATTQITTAIQGTSSTNPATSGYAIYSANPWLPNGYYWIKSNSMTNALQMYVDIKNGGYDFYQITNGTSVNDITGVHSGKALGLELVIPRSQDSWRAIYSYVHTTLGSNYSTWYSSFPIYNTSVANYASYAIFDQRFGNSGSTAGSYNGAPDWRCIDGGLWYIRDIPFGEPNGNYIANAFLGPYSEITYPQWLTSYGSPGYDDAGTNFSTGSTYLVSTNYAGSTVSTLYTYFDGSTSERAAPNALYIKNRTGTNTNGVYWINLPTVGATQVYCIMDTVVDGGGWMMAMKATRGTTFNYDSSHWTSVTTLNPTDNTRNDADAKFHSMNYFQGKDMIALWPDIAYNYGGGTGGSLTLSVYNNWCWMKNNYNSGSRQTLIDYFSNVSNVSFGTARGVERGTAFSGQAGNSFYGTNVTYYSTMKVRWGFSWNNENDWGTDDVSGGIGMYTRWSSSSADYSAGDFIGCCQDITGINRSARVEIYIR